MRRIFYEIGLAICLMVLGWVVSVKFPSADALPIGIVTFVLFILFTYLLNKEAINNIQSKRKVYFSREDAFSIYEQLCELVRKYRIVAEEISASHPGSEYKYVPKDERIREMMFDMDRVREKTRHKGLDKELAGWLAFIRKEASFSLNARTLKMAEAEDQYHQNIREYINTNFKSKEG